MQQCHSGTDLRATEDKQTSAPQEPKRECCGVTLVLAWYVPMVFIIEQRLLGSDQKSSSKGYSKLEKSIILVSITKLCKLYPLSKAQMHIICLMYINIMLKYLNIERKY